MPATSAHRSPRRCPYERKPLSHIQKPEAALPAPGSFTRTNRHGHRPLSHPARHRPAARWGARHPYRRRQGGWHQRLRQHLFPARGTAEAGVRICAASVLSPCGRNTALFDPETAYPIMSLMNDRERGLTDLGIRIDPTTRFVTLDGARLEAVLADKLPGAPEALREFGTNFANPPHCSTPRTISQSARQPEPSDPLYRRQPGAADRGIRQRRCPDPKRGDHAGARRLRGRCQPHRIAHRGAHGCAVMIFPPRTVLSSPDLVR